jgi:hypothetical protein
VFLFQLMYPMSDVPVTAWWALCLVLLTVKRRDAALAAGVAAGLAVLTRPNLTPVLIVPGAFLLWAAATERSARGQAVQRLLLFVTGPIPACLLVAYLNTEWYGGPLSNGYGDLDYLYGLENLWPNATRYPRWLLDSQTPVVLLALAAPFLLGRPAGADSRTHGPRALVVTWLLFIAAVIVTLVAWHGVQFAGSRAGFKFQEGERKYVAVGEYIAARLPDRAVFLSVQYSGSIRYYSGRLTVRFDWIPEHRLDSVIEQLRGLGYHPYIVLEQGEIGSFHRRFQGRSALAALDWAPRARLRHDSAVTIYDPADQRLDTEHQPVTDTIE